MSVTYYLVARRVPVLGQRPVPFGAAYGLLLYVIMNYVVVPLSAAGHGGAKDPVWVTLSIVVHAVLIGIPIALFTRRALQSAS
jgi:putative copper export protein